MFNSKNFITCPKSSISEFKYFEQNFLSTERFKNAKIMNMDCNIFNFYSILICIGSSINAIEFLFIEISKYTNIINQFFLKRQTVWLFWPTLDISCISSIISYAHDLSYFNLRQILSLFCHLHGSNHTQTFLSNYMRPHRILYSRNLFVTT